VPGDPSEVIGDLHGPTHTPRKDGETILQALRLDPATIGVVTEQRDSEQRRRLERRPQSHAQIAALDLPNRRVIDPDSLSELVNGPATLPAGSANGGAQDLGGVLR